MAPTVTATVVFTDLVGSTALSTSVQPDAADELRRTHFALLRGAVADHGGVEVKNLGDGLMVVFTSASRAVDCAVAMQQAVDRHNRAGKTPLLVRIGIGAGEVVEEDGDYFGDPVVEAARLCARADGGQILATQLVRMNCGRHAAHRFDPVGALELKGLPEPVEAVSVAWDPLPDDAAREGAGVPLPGSLGVEAPVRFVGRTRELAALRDAWKACATGARRVILVAGEAGLGKTRLVSELTRSAYDDGATVVYGGCEEGLAVTYRPWREALGHLLTHAPASVLDGVGQRRLSDLARVLPEVHERVPDLPAAIDSDAETERYLFWSAAVALLESAGRHNPTVVVLDDLHWVDRPSALLLRHLVTVSDSPGILLVGTYRDNEVGAAHPMADVLAAVHRAPGVERLVLDGLADDEVVAFVDAAAGAPQGASGTEFAHALRRETGGNPFFAWEVLRHLAETGAATRDSSGGWVTRVEMAELRLPDSVREVVGQRIRRLGGEVQRMLSLAAVVGDSFELDLVAAVAGSPVDAVLDELEEAERAGIVRSLGPDRFGFSHALIRHTLYGELSPARRARSHRLVAEALEASASRGGGPGPAGELARHWAAAVTASDAERAMRATCRAADEALAGLAPQEAARWFRQALELLDQVPDPAEEQRSELLCRLAEAMCQAGEPGQRDIALAAARLAQERGDTPRLVRAALSHYWSAAGEADPEIIAVLEAALEAVGPNDSAERTAILGRLKTWLIFADPDRAAWAGAEAVAVARRLGDKRLLVEALTRPGAGFYSRAQLQGFIDDVMEAYRISEASPDPATLFSAEFHRHWQGVLVADWDACQESIRHLLALAGEVGRPDLRFQAAFTHADWVLLQGDTEEAERLIDEVWELGRAHGQPGALAIYAAQMQALRWHQGRQHEVAGLLAEAAEANPSMSVMHLPTSGTTGLRDAVDAIPRDAAWLQAMTIMADVAVRAGDVEVCDHIAELIGPYCDYFSGEGPLRRGPVSHYLGTLAFAAGQPTRALGEFERAADINARLRAPFFIARTHIEQARVLRALDREPEATRLLDEALAITERHGYGQLDRRGRRLLAE
jgi:class 3 adenylate cyclase/tetratricopeptide (TPR) repeat protein